MQISILVPVYNEEKTLTQIIDHLLKLPLEKEIIAIDDASTDGSRLILQALCDQGKIIFLKHDTNRGKGAAILTGLESSHGRYTIIQDADLEYNPDDIIKLYEYAVENDVEVVFGSRISNPTTGRSYQRYYWGGRLLTFIANLLYRVNITDESTCYKMVKTDLLKSLNLTCRRFEFCPELVARLGKKNIRIHEIPIRYNPRNMEEGKKIRWHDGLMAIWTLVKLRLRP